MDLRASACRGAAQVKAVRAPRVAGSGATPRRPAREPGADLTRTGRAAVWRPGARRSSRRRPEWSTLTGLLGSAVPSSGGVLVRRVLAHPLLERQLTQAPGARADVTLRHVCGRPGALGLAEPPGVPRSSARTSWQRQSGFLLSHRIGLSPSREVAFLAAAEAGSLRRGRCRSPLTLPAGATLTRTRPEGQLLVGRGRGPNASAPRGGAEGGARNPHVSLGVESLMRGRSLRPAEPATRWRDPEMGGSSAKASGEGPAVKWAVLWSCHTG